MVFSSSMFDHITPLLRQLHWLKVPERIDYKLALLVYKCLQGVAPSYLADDVEARHRLRSASSLSLFRWLYCCACEVTLVITDTLIAVITYFTYLLTSTTPPDALDELK